MEFKASGNPPHGMKHNPEGTISFGSTNKIRKFTLKEKPDDVLMLYMLYDNYKDKIVKRLGDKLRQENVTGGVDKV